jgi:hypothetical protein
VCLSGLGGLSLEGRDDVPGQQFLDATNGMVWDLGQDSAQVELGVEAIQLRRSDQAVHGGGTVAAAVGTCKQVVLSPKSDSPQCPFGRAIVYLQQSILGVAREGTPARERLSNRCRGFALRRQRTQCLLHPSAHIVEQWSGSHLSDTQP